MYIRYEPTPHAVVVAAKCRFLLMPAVGAGSMDAPLPKVLPKEHDTAAESAAWPGWSPMEAMPWQDHFLVCLDVVSCVLE